MNVSLAQPVSTLAALPSTNRLDLSRPLAVFCALLVTAIAICGTLDARAPIVIDELKVLNQENVIGPVDMDLIASCRKNARGAQASAVDSQRCHDSRIVNASFHR